MELQSIGAVSKRFQVSLRTLRYYEQLGLIHSMKKGESAYRYYDEETIWRIWQIVVLRKLRIPLKQIVEVMRDDNALAALSVFRRQVVEISDEIYALSTIRSILEKLIAEINNSLGTAVTQLLLRDNKLLELVDSLTASKIHFKEDKTMDDLEKANQKLKAVAGSEIRIIFQPPATVASILFANDSEAEDNTWKLVNQFIADNELARVKPDFRHYAFDNDNGDEHGFERWVTIPGDMEVCAPYVKKLFAGGIYGARTIYFSSVIDWREEWRVLTDWVMNNDEYVYDAREPLCNNGLLEEHLNYINRYQITDDSKLQIDLLIPVKPKES